MKCPICGKGELLRFRGLPDPLDIVKLAKEHPVPILRNWAAEKAAEIKQRIESGYYYRRCSKCGFIALFEEV